MKFFLEDVHLLYHPGGLHGCVPQPEPPSCMRRFVASAEEHESGIIFLSLCGAVGSQLLCSWAARHWPSRCFGTADVCRCASDVMTWWQDDLMISSSSSSGCCCWIQAFQPKSSRTWASNAESWWTSLKWGIWWMPPFPRLGLKWLWAEIWWNLQLQLPTPTNLSRENRFIMMSIMWNSFMCLSRVVSRVFANFRKSLAIAQRSVRTFEVYSKRVPRPWKAQFHLCELTQCCGWVLCCFFRSSVDRISAAMCLKMCHECHIKHRQVMMHPNSKPWTSLWKIWPTITTQLRCFELAFARIGPNSDWKTLKWRNGRNMKKWFPFCWFFRVNRRPLLKSFARTSCWSTTLKWSVSWSNMVPWRTSQVSFESMFERNVWATKTWQKISY